jgi:predicted ATPase
MYLRPELRRSTEVWEEVGAVADHRQRTSLPETVRGSRERRPLTVRHADKKVRGLKRENEFGLQLKNIKSRKAQSGGRSNSGKLTSKRRDENLVPGDETVGSLTLS